MLGKHGVSEEAYVTKLAWRSGRNVFVPVGSNPMVTNVKLVPSPEVDDVAVTSSQSLMPCRDL